MKDLWSFFGLKPGASLPEIDTAYLNKRAQTKGDHKDLRLNWKILRDPFAASAYTNYKNTKAILEAGFFDDETEPEDKKPERDDLNWLTTPLHKIQKNYKLLDQSTIDSLQTKPAVILVTTGAFSPIHQGHLKMMENAKKELESRGRVVLGGYLSPSHDKYVSTKFHDALFLDTPHRLRLCDKAVADSDWLMVDAWEARYNDVPITYTDVLVRLEAYLEKHLRVSFPFVIYYVFGGDNAAFARLFIEKGGCVCIKRPSHEDRMLAINHDTKITSRNDIVIVDAFFDQPNISATQIRKGLKPTIPVIADLYQQWQSFYQDPTQKKTNFNYAIRNDSRFATKIWSHKFTPEESILASLSFIGDLGQALQKAFINSASPDMPAQIYPIQIDLNEQQDYVNQLDRTGQVINLDVCTVSEHKIHTSRLFNLCDGQCRSETLVARPGHESLSDQFSHIKPGEYTIVDDDIATGFTVDTIMKLAPSGIKATQKIGLLQKYLDKHQSEFNPEHNRQILDIVDLRDFLVGSQESGLVVRLPNGDLCRAPYLLPYVSLISRASIPPSVELSVAIQIWTLNLSFHLHAHTPVVLSDCDPQFQKLMKYIGFSDSDTISDICRWHISHLKRLAFR